jgi:hypothetical protein
MWPSFRRNVELASLDLMENGQGELVPLQALPGITTLRSSWERHSHSGFIGSKEFAYRFYVGKKIIGPQLVGCFPERGKVSESLEPIAIKINELVRAKFTSCGVENVNIKARLKCMSANC